jgi:hypothetical protein
VEPGEILSQRSRHTSLPAEVYGRVYFDDMPFEGVAVQVADAMMTYTLALTDVTDASGE